MSTKHLVAAAVTAVVAFAAPSAAQAACTDADLALTASNSAKVESAALCLINEKRAKVGAPALKANGKLRKAATRHVGDMLAHDFFDHTGSDGSSPFQRMTAAGYKWKVAAENLAISYPTATKLVAGWMGSSQHKQNMLNKRYADAGLAARTDGRTVLYTLTLGHR